MTDQEYDSLDLAVARAEITAGRCDVRISDAGVPTIVNAESDGWERFRPSMSWSHAGPIIELQFISITHRVGTWTAYLGVDVDTLATGPTPLVAAMRAYLASRRQG